MNKLAMGGLIPFLVMSSMYKSPPMLMIFILVQQHQYLTAKEMV